MCWMYKKQSFFPEGSLWMSLQMAVHMAFLKSSSREQEQISQLAFLMVILIGTPPHTYTWCIEHFLDVIVSAEGATSEMNIC